MRAPCISIHARPVGDSLSVRWRGPRAIEVVAPLGYLRQGALSALPAREPGIWRGPSQKRAPRRALRRLQPSGTGAAPGHGERAPKEEDRHNATAAVAPRCCFTSITDLELKRNGSVAWIAETIPSDLPLAPPGSYPDPRPDYQVQKADRAGPALLDAAHDIAARSLTRRGATITWMRGGAISSAVLD